MKILFKKPTQNGWQLIQLPNTIFFRSFYSTKKEVIKDAEYCYGRPWKESLKLGYRVVKAVVKLDRKTLKEDIK